MDRAGATDLIRFISRGDIDGVERWLRDEQPLRWQQGQRREPKSALETAVGTGFYSLVKFLLNHAVWNDGELARALDSVLWDRRSDLAELLLEHGADPTSVSFYSVFRTMDFALMEEFLNRGLDPCADNGFARILDEVRAKPLLRFYKEHRERYPCLDDQIGMALVAAIKSKNARWCALLIWAGADLNREVPEDYRKSASGDGFQTTPISEAIYVGDLPFLSALKITPTSELKNTLLKRATWDGSLALFKEVLKTCTLADLNCSEQGGCPVLGELVSREKRTYLLSSRPVADEEEKILEAIDLLLRAGAKWQSPEQISWVRRPLNSHDSRYVVRVIRMLLYTPGATSIEVIWELCRTDSIRAHIRSADFRLWGEILDLAAQAGIPAAIRANEVGKRKARLKTP